MFCLLPAKKLFAIIAVILDLRQSHHKRIQRIKRTKERGVPAAETSAQALPVYLQFRMLCWF